MIRRPPRSTPKPSSAASDVYKRQPVFHCLLELGQIHVGSFSDTVQPSHSLPSPSPIAFTLPNIRVFSRESSLLKRWPKYWSLSFRICPSSEHSWLISFKVDTFVLSTASSSTTIQKHQFFGGQPSLWSSSHFHTSLLEKPYLAYAHLCQQGDISAFKDAV